MGRSQRHKVMEQGISASQETWAEGVGEPWPGTAYNERGLPNNSGPPSSLNGAGTGGVSGPEPTEDDTLPLTLGAVGGPLQGSAVQSATSEGGTMPEPPDGGTEPEPPDPEPAPDPTLTSINPSSLVIDTGPQVVTVAGTDFEATDVINLDGLPLTTTFVSATELNAEIPTDGQLEGPLPVTVWYGTGMTNAVDVTFTSA